MMDITQDNRLSSHDLCGVLLVGLQCPGMKKEEIHVRVNLADDAEVYVEVEIQRF